MKYPVNYFEYLGTRLIQFSVLKSYLLLLLMLMCTTGYSVNGEEANDGVLKAYQLRIDGKSDDAKVLLQNILATDSLHPMANYEYARLILNTEMMNIEGALHHIDQALVRDPENACYLFLKAKTQFLDAYIAMHKNDAERINASVANSCNTFEQVLKINPACKEALLYLVDAYASLPSDMGGDKQKAEAYLEQLREISGFYEAQGGLLLMQEQTKVSDYWKQYIQEHGEDNDALEQMAKGYLMEDNLDQAKLTIEKLVQSDPSKQILWLDLARGHMMRVMQQTSTPEVELPDAKALFTKYLESEIETPVAVEAWCYGHMANFESFLGNKDQSDIYMNKATTLDPYFSRAFAIPDVDQSPDEVAYVYRSFFSPY